jgi:hypothetical protein
MTKNEGKMRENSGKRGSLLFLLDTEVKKPNIYTYIHTAYIYIYIYTHTHTYTYYTHTHTAELGYNDLSLCDSSDITL